MEKGMAYWCSRLIQQEAGGFHIWCSYAYPRSQEVNLSHPSTFISTDVSPEISVSPRSIISVCTKNYALNVLHPFLSKRSLDDVISRAYSRQSTQEVL